jgi:subtilase family protein
MKTAKTFSICRHASMTAKRALMSASVFAFALAAPDAAYAASSNFEYSNPSPFNAAQPSQPNLAQIHVTKALHDAIKTYIAYPAAKTKVVIAILDGLADYTHVDLSGHETDYLVYSGVYNRFDQHGTHVSGIAGAAQNNIGIVGVDPFATEVNLPVFDSRGLWVATDLGKRALDAAKSLGARVVNMSYGPTTPGDVFLDGELNLFQTYNSSTPGQGMVIVRAAGNSGVNAINEAFSGNASAALSNLLIVGSVNANNQISSFSNRPGAACIGACGVNNVNAVKNFFIVAPGENIISDLPSNYVGLMSGTSMATPEVTGASALVIQKALAGNTQLTPGQVAQILKLSADDLGAPGVDAVYGWGLLDVAAALNPIGTTYFPTGATVNSGQVVAQGSSIGQSGAISKHAVAGALSGAIVLDQFGRAFTVGAPPQTAAPSVFATNILQELTGDVFAETTELRSDGKSATFVTSQGDIAHGGLGVMSFDNGGMHLTSGLGASMSYFTSVDSATAGRSRSFSYTMAQDFFTGAGDAAVSLHQAMFFGGDMKASGRLTLSAIYLRTTPASFDQVPQNITAAMLSTQTTSSLAKFGAQYRIADGLSAGTSFGVLGEQGQTLGMRMTGGFSLGNGITYIEGANLSADLGEATVLRAFAEHSTTASSDGANSLVGANEWGGSKYGVSLTQSGAFGLPGNLRLTLVKPWQIDSGSLFAHVPVGREIDGTVDYEDRSVSIANGGTPLEIGLGYLSGGSQFRYGAEVRMLNRDVASESFSEYSVAGALHWSF